MHRGIYEVEVDFSTRVVAEDKDDAERKVREYLGQYLERLHITAEYYGDIDTLEKPKEKE